MKTFYNCKAIFISIGFFMVLWAPENARVYAQPEEEDFKQTKLSATDHRLPINPRLDNQTIYTIGDFHDSPPPRIEVRRLRKSTTPIKPSSRSHSATPSQSQDHKNDDDVISPVTLRINSSHNSFRQVAQEVMQTQRLLKAQASADLDNKGHLRVLSLDGGGIRGLLGLKILSSLEEISGCRVQDLFDVIAGTSTGGIMALGLSKGYSPVELSRIYTQNGEKIFPKSFIYQMYHRAWYGAKYSSEPLKEVLHDFFGSTKLSELQVPVLIPAYEISRGTTMLFLSRKAKIDPKFDYLIKSVALATSAAPTYFSPAEIQNENGDFFHLMDGGLTANNPATLAVLEGLKVKPVAKNRIILASLGTGAHHTGYNYKDLQHAGPLGLIGPVLDMMLNGATELNHIHMDTLLNSHDRQYYHLNPPIANANKDMDNASEENIEALTHAAKVYIKEHKALIQELALKLVPALNPANQNQEPPTARVAVK